MVETSEEHVEEIDVKAMEFASSLGELEQFLHSNVWKDIKSYLLAAEVELNLQMSLAEAPKLYRIQGAVQEVRILLGIPETMLAVLEGDIEDESKEIEEEEV